MNTEQTAERLVRANKAWRIAVDAMRRGDSNTVANQFAPDVDNKESYVYTITMGVVGALMCAQEIHRMTPTRPCDHDPPCEAFYSLESLSPEAWNDRNQVCAAQAVTCAANGDVHMLADLLCAHIKPNSVEETGVLLELLTMYLDLTDAHGDNQT